MLKPNKKPLNNLKAWLLILAWLFVGFVLGGLAGAVIHFAGQILKLSTESSGFNLLVGIVSYGTVLAVLIFGIRKIFKQQDVLSVLGLRGRLSWKMLLWVLVGAIAYFVLSWAVIAVISKLIPGFDPNALKTYARDTSTTPIDIITGLLQVAILTPIIEEVVFRGYMFEELKAFNMPIVIVIILTSLIFGLLHYPPTVWVIDTTIIGLVLAVMRYKTKNIWAGVILHILINTFAFFSLFVFK